MTPELITCTVDASLGDVAALLAERRIHGAFVVDGDGRVVGAISDMDLLSAEWLGTSSKRVEVMRSLTAGEMMTRPVVAVDAAASVDDAAARLKDAGLSRLLVKDGDAEVGVVSTGDLGVALTPQAGRAETVRDVMSYGIVVCHADAPVVAAARSMADRRSRSLAVLDPASGDLVGVLTGRDLLTAFGNGTGALTVADIMHSPVLTIAPDAPLSEAADAMLRGDVHRLFVCDPERLSPVPLGLISTADMSAAMARGDSVWQAPSA
jgi:CBS domain-containing protein